MGRTPNPRIKVNSKPIHSILKHIFEGAFFRNNPEYSAFSAAKVKNETDRRVAYIMELVKRYDPQALLIPRRLKDNFFEPWKKNGVITLSEDDLRVLGNFLRAAIHDFHYENHHSLVEEFCALYGDIQASVEVEEDKADLKNHQSAAAEGGWLIKNGPWYLYERIGDDDTRAASGLYGIGVAELSFTADVDRLAVKAIFYIDEREHSFKGEASFTNYSQYLHIIISSGYSGFKGLISLKLAEDDRPHQTLLLGHFTYHSPHYRHLLTKTIVVQKKQGVEPVLPKGDHYMNGTVFGQIDQRIRRFLYLRNKNRLSLPKVTITQIGGLAAFLSEQEEKSIKPVLEHYAGKYAVFYKGKAGIIEDVLEIGINHEKRYCEGKYLHKQRQKIFLGQAVTNDDLIEVRLIEYPQEPKQDKESILLNIQLPGKRTDPRQVECLPGLLSGLQDGDGLAVSYVCLLVRQSDPFQGAADPRVIRYFEGGPSMLTSRVGGFRLEELA